ncbi:MAG: nucleoside-diphosphate sugar epimerase, partial [Proteobacteria bacterium]|nr:nucleoside-diphosphate sugar epimerase [Pseudomonadota bacterium]
CAQVIHICPPMNLNEAVLAQQITDYCLAAGSERLVLYSVLHPLLRGVRHHGLKLDAEQYLVESGLTYTILQPGRYMQHLVPIWKSVMETGIHNMPFSVETRFSLADLGDLAEAAATVLTETGHENATYQLAGPEALNQVDMARIIGEVTGRDIRAEAKPLDVFRAGAEKAGMPADRLEQLCLLNRHYDHCGLIGNPNVLRWILGRDPTDFKTFVERDLNQL